MPMILFLHPFISCLWQKLGAYHIGPQVHVLTCIFFQVGVRLSSLGDSARGNKAFLDEHTSAMEFVTKDAKRKWETFAEQAENDCKAGSSFSAAKHCRMETMLQEWYV